MAKENEALGILAAETGGNMAGFLAFEDGHQRERYAILKASAKDDPCRFIGL